ncbi:MAG TPA: twin-arginine translocase subunit TatC [Phycisphaerae bacterium]|nr:twin-arginine translocase subunit TatC [Phycisphaerae bacterium]
MPLFRRHRRPLDPDDTRMSFGDHLEELRRRLIWALFGLVIAIIICFNFGGAIIETLTAPYSVAMQKLGNDPRMVQLNPIESFMEYFKISIEFGLVLAAPWIIYQVWLFVATGLYPSERKLVKYFAPSSIILFMTGATFMVTMVLSGLMLFLINISTWFPLPGPDNFLYRWLMPESPALVIAATQPTVPPMNVPVVSENPTSPLEGQIWINRTERRINAYYDGQSYYAPLQPAGNQQFVQPFFSISEYLQFVVNLALAFGLGFQIPILVIFLITLGIVPAQSMAGARRYVIIAVLVLAAVITPTPDVTTMLLLAVPMLLLFEAGLIVGRFMEKRKDASELSETSP